MRRRYGSASVGLIQAFKNTETVWEQGTNTLGVYTVSAHGNLAPLFWGPYSAWGNINSSISNITKGRAEWDRLGAELLHPTDETLRRIRKEIEETNKPDQIRVVAVPKPDLNATLREHQQRQLARDQQFHKPTDPWTPSISAPRFPFRRAEHAAA